MLSSFKLMYLRIGRRSAEAILVSGGDAEFIKTRRSKEIVVLRTHLDKGFT